MLEHQNGVSCLASSMARLLFWSTAQQEALAAAAATHDVGKLIIPADLLAKPGPLDVEQAKVVQGHSEFGSDMLTMEADRLGAAVAFGHHESLDGSAYPMGLRGEAIPLSARIVKICDCYDALREPHTYKPAMSHDAAMGIVVCGDVCLSFVDCRC